MANASTMAAFTPSMSCGLTSSASFSSAAAPVNSESTSTPPRSGRLATYSLATRFMPSRSGVTSMTSAAAKNGGELLAGQRLVQVVQHRVPDPGVRRR